MEQNRAFAQKYDFPFLLLCDTDRTIALAYGAVDSLDARAAKRISYLVAPDGTIAQVYAKVNVTEHANELLDSLGS